MPGRGALWGRAQPIGTAHPPLTGAPLYRRHHSKGLVGGTGEPHKLGLAPALSGGGQGRRGLSTADVVHLSGTGKQYRTCRHTVPAEDQVGESCDGKPSSTVQRAQNTNERLTTTWGARSIRRLVQLVIHF
ncbi:unnamed protein product [Victoria cruziana]